MKNQMIRDIDIHLIPSITTIILIYHQSVKKDTCPFIANIV